MATGDDRFLRRTPDGLLVKVIEIERNLVG
jgi:hypothetical protein